MITFRLRDLLGYDGYYLKHNGEAVWRHELAMVMHSVREGETTALADIVPDGFEGMVAFYDLYAKACGEAAKAIDQYLDGLGTLAAMQEAVAVMEAHNDARDCYLTSIDFAAWL